MFVAKDFSAVSISATDIEERSVSYDYKQFKKILKMTEVERESFFDKILHTDKFSASVTFNITMTVKQISNIILKYILQICKNILFAKKIFL